MTTNIDRSRSKIHEMVVRGANYREEYDFELYGEEVTAVLRPLVDEEFLPIAAFLASAIGEDELEESAEAVSEAVEKVDEADEVDGAVDLSELDDDFVAAMQRAARKGWYGIKEDDEVIELEDGEAEELLSQMMGGYSVEIGSQVLEISGDIRDAEKFR
jgi:hypothetical protein